MASLRKILSIIIGKPLVKKPPVPVEHLSAHRQAIRERNLIRREAKVGATVLGPVPAGHNREFFCLDRKTWIWSEEWFDEATKTMELMTVRYEFQRGKVLKTVNNIARGYVEGQELTNLLQAMQTYHDRIAVEVYGYTAATA